MNRLASSASSDSCKQAPTKLHVEEVDVESMTPSSDVVDSNSPHRFVFGKRQVVDRPRSFFLPIRYEPGYRYPLVVWLHNDGYNENQVRHVMPHISTRNYIGVGVRGSMAIDANGHRFAWSDSAAAVSRCEDAVWQSIDDACERYSIHRERVFIAGYGTGGTMARRIALRRSTQFAGCISLGGRLPRGGAVLSNLASARRLKNLWAIAIENPALSDDEFDRDIRLAADARLRLDVKRYTTDDEMVVEVLRDMNDWIMRVVTGQHGQANPAETWATTPVQFSAN